jgi:hypothetical protein
MFPYGLMQSLYLLLSFLPAIWHFEMSTKRVSAVIRENADATLVMLDTNWEKHTQIGNLVDESGCRYVNPAKGR